MKDVISAVNTIRVELKGSINAAKLDAQRGKSTRTSSLLSDVDQALTKLDKALKELDRMGWRP